MIVYLIVNIITEKAYVGQTTRTLEERWKHHREDAFGGSETRFARAIREWPDEELWLRVVVQICYTQEELDAWENFWINECSTPDGSIGYNSKSAPNSVPKRPLTEEDVEFFRAVGVVNSRKSQKRPMTEEEREKFRQWGRKGAQKSKLLAATRQKGP